MLPNRSYEFVTNADEAVGLLSDLQPYQHRYIVSGTKSHKLLLPLQECYQTQRAEI